MPQFTSKFLMRFEVNCTRVFLKCLRVCKNRAVSYTKPSHCILINNPSHNCAIQEGIESRLRAQQITIAVSEARFVLFIIFLCMFLNHYCYLQIVLQLIFFVTHYLVLIIIAPGSCCRTNQIFNTLILYPLYFSAAFLPDRSNWIVITRHLRNLRSSETYAYIFLSVNNNYRCDSAVGHHYFLGVYLGPGTLLRDSATRVLNYFISSGRLPAATRDMQIFKIRESGVFNFHNIQYLLCTKYLLSIIKYYADTGYIIFLM